MSTQIESLHDASIMFCNLETAGWSVLGFDALVAQLPDKTNVEFFWNDAQSSLDDQKPGWVCILRVPIRNSEPLISRSPEQKTSAMVALRNAMRELQRSINDMNQVPDDQPQDNLREDLF